MAAMSQNRAIGLNNRLPWLPIPADWANLHRVCDGKKMIMGRKSYDTPDRFWSKAGNVVVTRQADYQVDKGFVVATSLTDALLLYPNEPEIFVMGGEQIYRQALPFVDKIHLTIIWKDFEGDTYFPEFEKDFTEVSREDHCADDENHYDFSFLVFKSTRLCLSTE